MIIIQGKDFDVLVSASQKRDYVIVGTTVRDGAIVLDEIPSASDFPVGWTDEQENHDIG
jgi:hypothetical protein